MGNLFGGVLKILEFFKRVLTNWNPESWYYLLCVCVPVVYHPVACEACHRESFAGLRYKCQRCYNYNLCQDCFWRGRTSGNHQNDHDVKEYSFYVRVVSCTVLLLLLLLFIA